MSPTENGDDKVLFKEDSESNGGERDSVIVGCSVPFMLHTKSTSTMSSLRSSRPETVHMRSSFVVEGIGSIAIESNVGGSFPIVTEPLCMTRPPSPSSAVTEQVRVSKLCALSKESVTEDAMLRTVPL